MRLLKNLNTRTNKRIYCKECEKLIHKNQKMVGGKHNVCYMRLQNKSKKLQPIIYKSGLRMPIGI